MATKREFGDSLEDDIESQKPKKIRYDRGPSGTLLFTGPTEFEYINRDVQFLLKSDFTVWDPMRLAALDGLKVCFVSSGSSSAHMFAVTEEGKVYGWGRNEKGALGVGDKKDRRCPTLIKALEDHNVIYVATGKSHSLFLTDEGRIFASGDNENGQCSGTDPVFSEDDLGDSGEEADDPDKKKKKKKPKKPKKVQPAANKIVDEGPKVHNDSEVLFPKEVKWDGPPAKKIACGQDFNVLLDVKGSIWTWGHPEHGVIGDNNDRQFFEKLSKISFRSVYEPIRITNFVEREPKTRKASRVNNVFIKDISCGSFHTVAIDERNRAFSWGFGGYGRLGHSETTDEPIPRLIKHLDVQRKGITKVVAGRQFNLAFPEAKTDSVQMWGQFVSNKEANMYPKPLNDLAGMDIHEIACNNKGWMAVTDDGVIGAMGTTCTGEFANGERIKNSAKAVEIKTLNKFKVLKIGMSLSNTLFIVRDTGLDDQKFIKRLDILDQAEMEYE